MAHIPPGNISPLPFPPPGLEVAEWYGLVRAEGPSYETALRKLRDEAEAIAGANWIIQLVLQYAPNQVFASGIAVQMREIN